MTIKTEQGKPLALDVPKSVFSVEPHVLLIKLAPIAVCASVASVITKSGPGILVNFAKFLGGFYLTLAIMWCLLIAVGFFVIGGRMGELVRRMREPFLLAFSTASSEASYPKILEQLERFGVSKRIASFVLPLGYSFNLDGTMAYTTFASIFIAQAYGVALPLSTLLMAVGADDQLESTPQTARISGRGTRATTQSVRHSQEMFAFSASTGLLDMARSATT